MMLSVLPSAAQRFWLTSAETPATVEKWPCGAVVPSIVARKLPLESNTSTTALPASPTYTRFCVAAMLVGLENWPAPEPGMPAWQLAVQTSLWAWPSVTPHPKAATKLPLASNFCTRAFPLSATYTAPFVGATATPTGVWNWPAPEPWLPNVPRGTRTACAVATPSASVEAQTAAIVMRARPTRARHLRPIEIPVRALPPLTCGTRNCLIAILLLPWHVGLSRWRRDASRALNRPPTPPVRLSVQRFERLPPWRRPGASVTFLPSPQTIPMA